LQVEQNWQKIFFFLNILTGAFYSSIV